MADANDMIQRSIAMLQMLNEDPTIPRNVRKVADETMKILLDEKKQISLRASLALSKIDEIASDSNIPMHARTKVWEIASALEAVPLS
ncbi:MAG TPA: UPF0147 family protein [Methanocorpusculum sp.]|nr:UPF0147 family protein [Ruminococcus sp.]HJJ46289.1 UPF0147 family protein [Methanocorpusculum sp.]